MPNDLTHDANHRITNDITYVDNASHFASQRLLITRATALVTILHILITRAIPRANVSQRLLVTRATEFLKILHFLITRAIPRANASHRITNDFTYVDNASHSMLKTRAAICEYREHMNLYRVPRPSSCQSRLCVGFTVRFSHVSSCLLAPHPVYSFSVCFSPFSPSHYSVKTKCPLSLFPVLLSPLGPSLYSDKTKSPFHSFPVLLSPLRPSHYPVKTISPPFTLFQYIAFSNGSLPLLRQNQILPFTLFQYGIAFSIRYLSLLR